MWVLEVKKSGRCSIEVAALLRSNTHGKESWGWHSKDDKIIVLAVSDLYQKWPIPKSVIAAAIAEAKRICDMKNKK